MQFVLLTMCEFIICKMCASVCVLRVYKMLKQIHLVWNPLNVLRKGNIHILQRYMLLESSRRRHNEIEKKRKEKASIFFSTFSMDHSETLSSYISTCLQFILHYRSRMHDSTVDFSNYYLINAFNGNVTFVTCSQRMPFQKKALNDLAQITIPHHIVSDSSFRC